MVNLDDIRRELGEGNRVLLLVRHGERPQIDNEDPTFGAALPLTSAGREMSRAFGAALKGSAADVRFRASPLLRTVQTAAFIAEGMGLGTPEIPTDPVVGNSCAFVADEHEVWEVFRDGAFFARMDEYLHTGRQRGFHPLASAAANYEREQLARFTTGQLGIFTTHDLYIAAYLHAKGVKTDFSRADWPRFLDAAALIGTPDGAWRTEYVRSGFSDGICGVRSVSA